MSTPGRRARRRRRVLAAAGLLVVAIVVGVLAVLGWYRTQLTAADGPHDTVELTIPAGASTAAIAERLAAAEIVRNARVFGWHVRFSGAGPFEAGRYRFERNSSADAAIAVLEAGALGPVITKVSIPEGFRVAQIKARIHEAVPRLSIADLDAALAEGRVRTPLLAEDGRDYEGLLFPATYDVTPDDSAVDVLQMMADAMTERVVALQADPIVSELGLDERSLVTVASLVQAEAGNPDEAPKIARVIYNRLAAGQPLGIDATSRYLSIITGDEVDFESTSPYNTRREPGLPPTPIAAPGQFALEAAAHPADGDWLYYVLSVDKDAQGRPQHVFTASAEEFAEAKQACHEAGLGCGPS